MEANHAAAELALAEIKTEHLELELVRSRALGAQEVISTLRAKLLDADFDTQQSLLRLLVERVVVDGQSLEIHLALPVSSNCGLTSETMKEPDRADLGIRTGSWARISQRGANGPQEDAQHSAGDPRVVVQEGPEAFRHREHPLALIPECAHVRSH